MFCNMPGFACPVWHNSLTNEQSDQLESIQKRALKIICGSSFIDYEHMCFCIICHLYLNVEKGFVSVFF